MFLLHGAILPVSFFSLIVSGCKSEHDAERVVPTASVVNSPKDQCTLPNSAICTRPPVPGLHTFSLTAGRRLVSKKSSFRHSAECNRQPAPKTA
jgi:hypothetical protein